MTTVAEILDSTLFDLVIAGAEVSVSSVDASQFIFKLNNMVETMIGGGVTVTWTTVSNLGDTIIIMDQADTPVDISKYCIQFLASKMAELLAPQYGVSISPETRTAIREGKKSMLKKSRKGTFVNYPSTLPVGSGNEDGVFRDDHFYTGTTAGETTT